MENLDVKIETYVSAISRLYTLASNKRYKVKNFQLNFSDEVGKIAERINEEICNKIHIDIFKSQLIESTILYENELNNLFSDYTSKNIIEDKELEDELFLLRSHEEIDPNYFVNQKFEIKVEFNKFLKKESNISTPSLLQLAKKPMCLHRIIDNSMTENFFATAIVKNIIVFYHLTIYERNPNLVEIITVLTFNISRYKGMHSNPTRMFLNILDDYGIDLTINDETRRFFKYAKVLNQNYKGDLDMIKIADVKKDEYIVISRFTKKEFGMTFTFTYGINRTKYLKN